MSGNKGIWAKKKACCTGLDDLAGSFSIPSVIEMKRCCNIPLSFP